MPICILCYLAAALPGGLALLNVADAFVAAPAASSNLRGAAVPQAGISFAQNMFSLQLSINIHKQNRNIRIFSDRRDQ